MPTFQFEAMDATGQEIRDVIEAATEEDAQTTIRQMGYFVTKIQVKKQAKTARMASRKKRSFAVGGASTKLITTFTRQLSILQDAGLPILRSLKILEGNSKPGRLKNALLDVCDEIEGGSTLSEAMAKSPRVFNRLYINMIKAGEAGGALEIILQRLAEFMERAESLKRKVKGAMIYPIVVIMVAVGILTFIMLKIVPVFREMFEDFELTLPAATELLISVSDWIVDWWFLIPAFPIGAWLFVKLIRKFRVGRMGYDMFILKVPILGKLIEKNTMARTTRTLGTLVASGVPILEGLTITRETAGNALFERLYGRVTESIREGESIAKPLKDNSKPGFHPVALFFWMMVGVFPCLPILFMPAVASIAVKLAGVGAILGALFYLMRMNGRIVDDLVVNMVDVGEETGELDTMLFKVADTFDEEVRTLTDGLMALLEPLLIVFLGGAVGFIVISLFMPLVSLITSLSG
ncbi:MAG TPA: type II secretion system F family protein [Planctomycetes bacterium]|nr:type II secretion system F family protein [Planctomycetaceae bacterium]HIM30553.1 type II secretion system F family protein [Planctomycetota bacterium]